MAEETFSGLPASGAGKGSFSPLSLPGGPDPARPVSGAGWKAGRLSGHPRDKDAAGIFLPGSVCPRKLFSASIGAGVSGNATFPGRWAAVNIPGPCRIRLHGPDSGASGRPLGVERRARSRPRGARGVGRRAGSAHAVCAGGGDNFTSEFIFLHPVYIGHGAPHLRGDFRL